MDKLDKYILFSFLRLWADWVPLEGNENYEWNGLVGSMVCKLHRHNIGTNSIRAKRQSNFSRKNVYWFFMLLGTIMLMIVISCRGCRLSCTTQRLRSSIESRNAYYKPHDYGVSSLLDNFCDNAAPFRSWFSIQGAKADSDPWIKSF